MGWEIARGKAWDEIEDLSSSPEYVIGFLDEEYEVNLGRRAVLSISSGLQADEGITVLILHYLIGIQRSGGYNPSGEWISFRELKGGISFLPAFQETVIKPLAQCIGKDSDGFIKNLLESFGGRIVEGGDVAVELTAFPGVNVRVVIWLGDEDLPPDATMLFDKSLARIYTTEDIAVFLQLISGRITENCGDLS